MMWMRERLILLSRYAIAGFLCSTACVFIGDGTPVLAAGGPLPPANVTITPDPTQTPSSNLGLGTATRFIRVSGSGVARTKPTEARIIFLVSTTKPMALAALKYNELEVAQVRRGLQLGGVPQENISWSPALLGNPPSLAPAPPAQNASGAGNAGSETPVDTAPTGGTGSPEGVPAPQPPSTTSSEPQFTAYTRLDVITHEINDVNGIEQIAMNAGATGVQGITLEAQNLPDIKQRALIAALKDAANKAEILALGVKVRVLYAISVSEQPAPPDPSNSNVAPPTEISVPVNIEVVYAIG